MESLFFIQSSKDKFPALRITKTGEACEFLQFIINTSNFHWRKKPEDITSKDFDNQKLCIISKLCAIGYLLTRPKTRSVTRAVIAVDQQENVTGRTGKSLFFSALSHAVNTVFINGSGRFYENRFCWSEINQDTRLVILEDVASSFEFEYLFSCISGDWTIVRKGQRSEVIPYAYSPRIAITTQRPFQGIGCSFSDRQWYLYFSDFYNIRHNPVDDFGHILTFDQYNDIQRDLFTQLMGECVWLFQTFGVILSEGDNSPW